MLTDRLRHPAFHIIVLGVLVAVAILVLRGAPTGEESRRVVVTGSDVLQLRAGFVRTWQRQPTDAELRGLVERHIRQEVLYREALARGYDRDDPVVRQAMQQKMEFLAAAQGGQGPPTDDEIEAYFALRREKYRLPAVVSLAQVYINSDAGQGPAEQRAEELLARLERDDPGPDELAVLGDSIMLSPTYDNVTENELASIFGRDFADAVVALEPGSWRGPIRSGYGLHLVKVTRRRAGRVPSWTEVRPSVVRDMEYEATTAAKEQLYQELVQTYRIVTDAEVAALLE
ncbi:MAG: peptidyl-prolyl cis-trans isomerase, partial [Holophagae bacterium]